MRAVCGFCDFFVIASGSSQRQVNAIADAVQEDLQSAGIKTLSPVNPNDASGWSVVDYGSVIVHVFFKPMREFYSLEHLWQGAKHVRVSKK
jgi:ribosome-associated protein